MDKHKIKIMICLFDGFDLVYVFLHRPNTQKRVDVTMARECHFSQAFHKAYS